MALYSAIQKFITKNGVPVEGASCLVFVDGSTTKPALFATRTGGALDNPFHTNSQGNALCFVSPGRYKMVVTKDGDQVTFEGIEVGPVSLVGSFADGGTVSDPDQWFATANGDLWAWGGALNKTVSPGEDPTAVAGWSRIVDNSARAEILGALSDAGGAALVNFGTVGEIENATGEDITDAVNLLLDGAGGGLDGDDGAALVGFEGSTVYGALDLQIRRPRKTIAKLFASASAVSHIKLCVLGDSLSGAKPSQFIAALDRKIGGENRAGVNSTGNASAVGTTSGGADLTFDSTVNMVIESNFNYWPTGSVRRFDDGGSALLRLGGANPNFTDIKVYFVKEPSAGTINLTVDGSVVDTESAAAASVSVGVLQFTQTLAQKSASISITGGSVRLLFAHVTNSTLRGVDWYNSMNVGGLLLANAVSTTQVRAIWQSCLSLIQPDLITFEMDDNFGDGGTNAAAWLTFAGILDAAAPNADKLITASTPRASDDAGKLASSRFLRGQVAARGNDYLFFDSYNIFGSYAQMVAIFGADDGTHPNAAAQAFAAESLWQQLGLSANVLGYAQQAVNNVGTPSAMARNSQFRGPSNNPLARIAFETDSANGYDWVFKFPRTLTFGTDGNFNTSAASIWQFSGNTNIKPNVIPTKIKFGTEASTYSFDFSTASGYNQMRFLDTANASGYLEMKLGALHAQPFTVATLPTANTRTGSLIYVSDGAVGGASGCFAYSNGGASWLRLSDDSVIS